jgi:glutamyl/glutaminyl-tRNA synthetase
MTQLDLSQPPFNVRVDATTPRALLCDFVAEAMRRAGLLETSPPPAALRWIETFVDAYRDRLTTVGDALPYVQSLRAEAALVPALELERLRNRQVLFFLDTVSQYVDSQAELRGLPLDHDLTEMATEFGLKPDDARWAVRMALTGAREGPPLEMLFPLLGHDRIMMRVGAINSHLLHGRGLEPIKYGPDGKPFEPIAGTKPA